MALRPSHRVTAPPTKHFLTSTHYHYHILEKTGKYMYHLCHTRDHTYINNVFVHVDTLGKIELIPQHQLLFIFAILLYASRITI